MKNNKDVILVDTFDGLMTIEELMLTSTKGKIESLRLLFKSKLDEEDLGMVARVIENMFLIGYMAGGSNTGMSRGTIRGTLKGDNSET